ncbi:hypothetical protein [Streptomyces flavalbus]|uniref:Uncharacterized protein n=1 Tax=Streptomyces flavalbus TaxID=2665155 RepID=A0ABW2W3E7_9ACTN
MTAVLTVLVLLPTVAAALLLCVPGTAPRGLFGWAWVAVAAVELGLAVAVWAGYEDGLQYETRARWIPSAGVSHHGARTPWSSWRSGWSPCCTGRWWRSRRATSSG